MKIFLDTANIEEIREGVSWGIIEGVTTNPSLMAKEKGDFKSTILQICDLVKGPVSVEAVSLDHTDIVTEAEKLSEWAPNIVIKIPVTPEGLKAVRILSSRGIKINVTLVFSVNQAILAACAGASYVSPFIGRIDDVGSNGIAVARDIVEVFKNYNYDTQVIIASVRHAQHVVEAAKIGAPIVTVPFNVLKQMIKHPLTDVGIKRFLEDWEKVKAITACLGRS